MFFRSQTATLPAEVSGERKANSNYRLTKLIRTESSVCRGTQWVKYYSTKSANILGKNTATKAEQRLLSEMNMFIIAAFPRLFNKKPKLSARVRD